MQIAIENTRFIFRTNFAGDPTASRFASDKRRGTIIIPDPVMAQDLANQGVNIKYTSPRPGEEEGFVPEAFAPITVNYNSKFPPAVYLITDNAPPVLLDAGTVGMIDGIRVRSVDVTLNVYENRQGNGTSLYVRSMYVTQDLSGDPFMAKYFPPVIPIA